MKGLSMVESINGHYVFGQIYRDLSKEQLEMVFKEANSKKYSLIDIKVRDIMKIIDKVSNFWLSDNSLYPTVFENLQHIGFSPEMIKLAITELCRIFTMDNLEKRITVEIGDIEVLDNWVGNVRLFPLGVLAHITAGNVFVSAIDSLLCGIITKNINIVKTSSKVGNFFGLLWIDTLKKAEKELQMEGLISNNIAIISASSEELIEYLNKYTDGVVVWGGYEAIKFYRTNYEPTKRLILYGPKYSIAVIDQESIYQNIDQICSSLAWDICLWEQRACSSVQTVYLLGDIDQQTAQEFCQKLSQAIQNFQIQQPELSFDEYTELFKYHEISIASQVLGKGKYLERVLLDFDKYDLFIGPLNRFVCVKVVKNLDQLKQILSKYHDILQSCSLKVKDSKLFCKELATCGITRFVEIGKIGFSEVAAPHEGEFILRNMSKLIYAGL
ncbi:MAG: acyl-CoA reductase [bacterium]